MQCTEALANILPFQLKISLNQRIVIADIVPKSILNFSLKSIHLPLKLLQWNNPKNSSSLMLLH